MNFYQKDITKISFKKSDMIICLYTLQFLQPKFRQILINKIFNDWSIKKKCVACDGKIPPFDKSEIHKYLKKVDGWDVKTDIEKSFYLIKEFKFKDFKESQIFVNKVGNLAEEENHHPDISFGWGYCKVKIFTHAIQGLAESDFILAAKIDEIN